MLLCAEIRPAHGLDQGTVAGRRKLDKNRTQVTFCPLLAGNSAKHCNMSVINNGNALHDADRSRSIKGMGWRFVPVCLRTGRKTNPRERVCGGWCTGRVLDKKGTYYLLRLRNAPNPNSPRPRSARVPGSGISCGGTVPVS